MSVGKITLLGIRQIRLLMLSFKRRFISMNVSESYLVKVEVSQMEGTSVTCKANYLRGGGRGLGVLFHLLYHLLYPCFEEERVYCFRSDYLIVNPHVSSKTNIFWSYFSQDLHTPAT